MKQDASATGKLSDRRQVLNNTDLVVDVHQGHEHRVRAQRRRQLVEIDKTILFRVEICYFKTFALEMAAGIEHGLVFGLAGNDVLAFALVELCRTLDGKIVGFSGAGGPDDLLGIGTEQRGDLRTRLLYGLVGMPAE